jgi:hypothetical protein
LEGCTEDIPCPSNRFVGQSIDYMISLADKVPERHRLKPGGEQSVERKITKEFWSSGRTNNDRQADQPISHRRIGLCGRWGKIMGGLTLRFGSMGKSGGAPTG